MLFYNYVVKFYELLLREAGKSAEEIPTRKRAVYRRRFALLDEIDEAIEAKMAELKNSKSNPDRLGIFRSLSGVLFTFSLSTDRFCHHWVGRRLRSGRCPP